MFMACWKSTNHQRLYLYGHPWHGISLVNNWGGQLDNPIHAGIYWGNFWKYGVRWMYHNAYTGAALGSKV